MFLTKPQKRVFLISPNWFIAVMSRGTGKTVKIQAIRSFQTAEAVPGGLSVFYNATYIGAQQRTVSDTLKGWRELGLIEGIDFVKNIKPPSHFGSSDYNPLNYKNVISYKNGHKFMIASNDRPGMVNSLSITGGSFIDEARFLNEKLMRQDLYPAIRGRNIWGKNNPFVFSRTYTSDMPFITDDALWLLEFANKMNKEQITLIVQSAIKVEKLKNKIIKYKKLYASATSMDVKRMHLNKISSFNKLLIKKQEQANAIRMNYNGVRGSVYFDTASFISNINILGIKYFLDNADPRNELVTKTSFLNIKPEEVENKFYSHLHARHFITGNFNYSNVEELGIPDKSGLTIQASDIMDYDPMKPIDIELDYGDMCTCSISQTFGNEERYIASFEVILPKGVDDLVIIVNNFLQHHMKRVIYVYKDPSGNSMKDKRGKSYGPQTINKLKEFGWTVFDKTPPGSYNPLHDDKHLLINMILSEKHKRFPFVRIIRDTNMQLESSLNKAPRLVVISAQGKKEIRKDKSSEKKLKLEDKPMNSTDHSDHFDIKLWHKYEHLLAHYGSW